MGDLSALLHAPPDQYADLSGYAQADRGLGGQVISNGFNPSASPTVGNLLGATPDANVAPPEAPGTTSYQQPQPGAKPAGEYQSTGDPLQDVRNKLARNEPVSAQDMMLIDAAQQRMNAGGGGASSTSTTVSGVSKGDLASLKRLQGERDTTIGEMGGRYAQLGQIQRDAATEQSQVMAERAAYANKEVAAMQQRQSEHAATVQRMSADQTKAQQDYVKSAQEIDPNRIMRGGKGVMAAIGMAFGAAGAALARSPNFAQEIIDNALSRDLDAQKTALGAKKDALSMAQQAFQNYRAIYQDDDAAHAAVKATVYDAYASKIGALGAKLQGREQQAAAYEKRDQLMLASNAMKQQAVEFAAQRVSTTTQSQASGGGTPVDAIKRMGEYADVAKKINESNAQNGAAPSTQDRVQFNDVAKAAGDYAPVVKLGAKMQDLLKRTTAGGLLVPGQDSRAYDTVERQLRMAILNASSGKVFTEKEQEEVQKMLDHRAFTNDQKQQKLQEVQNYVASKIQSQISTLHPELRQNLFNRMKAGGIDQPVLDSMFSGHAPQSTAEQGAALGLKPAQ